MGFLKKTCLFFTPYLASISLIIFLFFWTLGHNNRIKLDIPLQMTGDLTAYLALVKAMIQNEWFPFFGITLARAGAPFGPVNFSGDYPQTEQLQFLIMRLIGFFSHNPAAVLNIYYILTHVLAAWATIFALSYYQIAPAISIVAGVLFSFLPYHYSRYEPILLAGYYLVPIATLIILWIWGASPLFFERASFRIHKRKQCITALSCIAIGFWHPYYAFFFCLFVVVSGISASLYRRRLRPLFVSILLVCITTCSLGITLLPTLIFYLKNGQNVLVAQRQPEEAEMYGLKITQVFLPNRDHRIPWFRKIGETYVGNQSGYGGLREYLGLIPVIGIFISLFSLFSLRSRSSTVAKVGVNVVAGILYATIGGFSSIFSYFFSPLIRCPERINPYLGYFGLLSATMVLSSVKKRIHNGIFYFTLVLVLVFGLVDQISPKMGFQQNISEWESDKSFISTIEKTQESGVILQLPFHEVPEGIPAFNVSGYHQLKGYVHSNHLYWSFGAMKGRDASTRIRALSQEPLDLDAIRSVGYTGIFINRNGYQDDAKELQRKLSLRLHQWPIESTNGRLLFFDLSK